jgi:prepilin-type N-terminal cleavage/methylation domain-containing protein
LTRLVDLLRSGDGGYTLVEMVIVMAILAVVTTGLTTVFVNGSNAELTMNRRFQAQQQARFALDKIRGDIHCASAAQAQTIGSYSGLKLNVANCSATTPTVSWCAVPYSTSTTRYQLYRSTATTNICTASDTTRLFVADYLTTGTNAFVTATIPRYSLQTVAVDFKISANPTTTKDIYELKDSIVTRNATRCTTSSTTYVSATATCTAPSVP